MRLKNQLSFSGIVYFNFKWQSVITSLHFSPIQISHGKIKSKCLKVYLERTQSQNWFGYREVKTSGGMNFWKWKILYSVVVKNVYCYLICKHLQNFLTENIQIQREMSTWWGWIQIQPITKMTSKIQAMIWSTAIVFARSR